jgi:3-deoxy-D-manno-octulosonic-acid transferase
MFLMYNFFSFLALLLYLPSLFLKKGPENRRAYITERTGITEYVKTDIWIHAVSVGEVIAALPFYNALKKEFPSLRIVISTTTYTGQKIAREKFPGAERVMYMPWDTVFCIRRAVRFMKPNIFITIETELWPSLFRLLNDQGVRIVVLNGRISRSSYRGYRRIRPYIKKVLSNVHFFYMQGKGDVERIISLGAEPSRVGLMGNLKFDMNLQVSKGDVEWFDSKNGLLLVAGSTHKGEEEIILDAFTMVKERIGNIKLILAPRHPERFREAEDILKAKGLAYAKRSGIRSGETLPDIVLLDTIGELSALYSQADITFVGGSLVPFGGHNILEPAYWGKPVLFGPHMDNFPMASDFLKEEAAIEVKHAGEMADAILNLLSDHVKAERMGRRAEAIVRSNTGAVEKAAGLLRELLGTTERSV